MKYYAVKRGKNGPVIHTDWLSCEADVKGFQGAKFKSFKTNQEAEDFLNEEENILTTFPEGRHIMCDGSSSIKQNFYQYRLVWSDDGSLIYESPMYKNGSNNCAEVLGLYAAIRYRHENNLSCNIYCDSVTAMTWVSKGLSNIKTELASEETRKRIQDSLDWIKSTGASIDNITHYNNKIIGVEIKADFGRK